MFALVIAAALCTQPPPPPPVGFTVAIEPGGPRIPIPATPMTLPWNGPNAGSAPMRWGQQPSGGAGYSTDWIMIGGEPFCGQFWQHCGDGYAVVTVYNGGSTGGSMNWYTFPYYNFPVGKFADVSAAPLKLHGSVSNANGNKGPAQSLGITDFTVTQ